MNEKFDQANSESKKCSVLLDILEPLAKAKDQLKLDWEQHQIVLLKNQDNILPFSSEEEILVIGDFWNMPRYQGAGSSLINPLNLVSPKEGHPYKDRVTFSKGYDVTTSEIDIELINQAVNLAKSAKKVIILAGLTDLYESEGFDRTNKRSVI